MKIALISDSQLLNRSLEIYLKDYLTSYKLCDFIVTTKPMEANKPIFLIGDYEEAHLKKPFTKELLLQKLQAFYLANLEGQTLNSTQTIQTQEENKEQNKIRETNLNSATLDLPNFPPQTTQSSAKPLLNQDLEQEIDRLFARFSCELKEILLKYGY
ncbi:hypothetical protein B6S12_00860 [Helicobacter valdiviensis]|uniref:JHP0747 family protein n=1 Tax=Helicobacter valdiviensis TaxID=1458358 RepID=A0A2W6MZR5_9HELI|nr:hypothetical protein [Helicobacter valdiviensis]PZT48878.1 hypothetical protein B6S12_00860 [Helicobacter valdiviensis]